MIRRSYNERSGWDRKIVGCSLAGTLALSGCGPWEVDDGLLRQTMNEHIIESPVDCQSGPTAGDVIVDLNSGYKTVQFGNSRLQMFPDGDQNWQTPRGEQLARIPFADVMERPSGKPIERSFGGMTLRILPAEDMPDRFWVSLHCAGAEPPVAPPPTPTHF